MHLDSGSGAGAPSRNDDGRDKPGNDSRQAANPRGIGSADGGLASLSPPYGELKCAGGELIPVPMPACRIRVGRGPVVPGIVIDVSVPGIEAVIACKGAAIAPVRIVPRRPRMPAGPWPEVCRI